MRCVRVGLATWTVAWLWTPLPVAAHGFDALGAPVGHRDDLTRDPGARMPPGLHLRASIVEPFLGTAIREHHVAVTLAATDRALAVHGAWQRSDVHRRLQVALAVQRHVVANTLGMDVRLRQWVFRNGATRRRWRLRFAWGVTLPAGGALSVHFEPRDDALRPHWTFSCRLNRFAPFDLIFQEERVAGFAARRRWGLTWGDRGLALRLGFDMQTATTSVGVSLASRRWLWDVTASAHPVLGWSRLVGLDWSR